MSTLLASVGLRCVAWRSSALHDGVMEKWRGIGRLGSQPRLASHLNLAPDSVKAFHYLTNFIETIFRKKQVGAKHLFR
jgi:hypothetical protein